MWFLSWTDGDGFITFFSETFGLEVVDNLPDAWQLDTFTNYDFFANWSMITPHLDEFQDVLVDQIEIATGGRRVLSEEFRSGRSNPFTEFLDESDFVCRRDILEDLEKKKNNSVFYTLVKKDAQIPDYLWNIFSHLMNSYRNNEGKYSIGKRDDVYQLTHYVANVILQLLGYNDRYCILNWCFDHSCWNVIFSSYFAKKIHPEKNWKIILPLQKVVCFETKEMFDANKQVECLYKSG